MKQRRCDHDRFFYLQSTDETTDSIGVLSIFALHAFHSATVHSALSTQPSALSPQPSALSPESPNEGLLELNGNVIAHLRKAPVSLTASSCSCNPRVWRFSTYCSTG